MTTKADWELTAHGKLVGAPDREMEIGLGYVTNPNVKTQQELRQERHKRRNSEVAKIVEKLEKTRDPDAPVGIVERQEYRIGKRDQAATNLTLQVGAAKSATGSKITTLTELKELRQQQAKAETIAKIE